MPRSTGGGAYEPQEEPTNPVNTGTSGVIGRMFDEARKRAEEAQDKIGSLIKFSEIGQANESQGENPFYAPEEPEPQEAEPEYTEPEQPDTGYSRAEKQAPVVQEPEQLFPTDYSDENGKGGNEIPGIEFKPEPVDTSFRKNVERNSEREDETEFYSKPRLSGYERAEEAKPVLNSGAYTDTLFPTDYGGTTIPGMPATSNPFANPRNPITRDQFLEATSNLFNPLVNFGVPSASAEALYDLQNGTVNYNYDPTKDFRPDVTGRGYDVARRNADVVTTPRVITPQAASQSDMNPNPQGPSQRGEPNPLFPTDYGGTSIPGMPSVNGEPFLDAMNILASGTSVGANIKDAMIDTAIPAIVGLYNSLGDYIENPQYFPAEEENGTYEDYYDMIYDNAINNGESPESAAVTANEGANQWLEYNAFINNTPEQPVTDNQTPEQNLEKAEEVESTWAGTADNPVNPTPAQVGSYEADVRRYDNLNNPLTPSTTNPVPAVPGGSLNFDNVGPWGNAQDLFDSLPDTMSPQEKMNYIQNLFTRGTDAWNYRDARDGVLPDSWAVPEEYYDNNGKRHFNPAMEAIMNMFDDTSGYITRKKDGKEYKIPPIAPEQVLDLWLKPGDFHEPGDAWRGLENIPEECLAILATDPRAGAWTYNEENQYPGNYKYYPNKGEYFNGTADEYDILADRFLDAVPALRTLINRGVLTAEDVARFFFKKPRTNNKPKYTGTGYGTGYKRYYGGGGGGRYYGGGGGGYSSGGSAPSSNQKTNRVYNIMKNWSF